MKKILVLLIVLVTLGPVKAQFFSGNNIDYPVPIVSEGLNLHFSTYGGFKIEDGYYTDPNYEGILPPFGIGLGASYKNFFLNLGYSINKGPEITFQHVAWHNKFFYAMWGVNGLLIPGFESEGTEYVPADSSGALFRIPIFASINVKPIKYAEIGFGAGLGKYGLRERFEQPLATPGFFGNVTIKPTEFLRFTWEWHSASQRRNIGIFVGPFEGVELFANVRYAHYWIYDKLGAYQAFVGVRAQLPIETGCGEKTTQKEALQKLEECRAKVAALSQEISELENEYNALVNEENDLDSKIASLQNEIAELKAEIAKYPTEYTVQKGDYLSKIAAQRYIYNNWKSWPRIYRANRDLIKDPNLIYPGWVLKIPHGIVTEIEVIPGDCLWKIAGFTWIYNNPRLWTTIYEANRDQIKDPNLIYPKQVLKIPR